MAISLEALDAAASESQFTGLVTIDTGEEQVL